MYLYKFKAGNQRDIQALENNQLWVSTYQLLNDPYDFPVYVSEDITDKEVDDFLSDFVKNHYCLSFSQKINVRRLWNYYTDGFKGLVICYENETINKALKEQLALDFIKNNKKITIDNFAGVGFEGMVKYDGLKADISKIIRKKDEYIESSLFFHKDVSWQEEKEYRYVFSKDKDDNKVGFLLEQMYPHHIFVGHNMPKENKERIIAYCKKQNINLYEYKANYKDVNSNKFIKKCLFDKNKLVENKEFEEILE